MKYLVIAALFFSLSLKAQETPRDCELLSKIKNRGVSLREFHSVTFSVPNSCDPRLLHPLWVKALTKSLNSEEKLILVKKICGSSFGLHSSFDSCLNSSLDEENLLLLEEDKPQLALEKINNLNKKRAEKRELVVKVLKFILN